MLQYCQYCNEFREPVLRDENVQLDVKGQPVKATVTSAFCPVCGNNIFVWDVEQAAMMKILRIAQEGQK